jgi:hypothetical protein
VDELNIVFVGLCLKESEKRSNSATLAMEEWKKNRAQAQHAK